MLLYVVHFHSSAIVTSRMCPTLLTWLTEVCVFNEMDAIVQRVFNEMVAVVQCVFNEMDMVVQCVFNEMDMVVHIRHCSVCHNYI